jgi:post-segregation antitoxin (ccd killing protein)
MVNYGNGKVYKIESHLGDNIYIGSTTKEYLSQRMYTHRRDYAKWKKGNNRRFITSFNIFEEYGVKNCKMILLESVPCNSKDELTAHEAYYIRNLECVNITIPGRSQQEYRETNREQILAKKKLYQEANRELLNEKAMLYREVNREVLNEKAKLYREANKEARKEKAKLYYQAKKKQVIC